MLKPEQALKMTTLEDLRAALEQKNDVQACKFLNFLLANDPTFNANYTSFKQSEDMKYGGCEGSNAGMMFHAYKVVEFLSVYYPKTAPR